MTIERSEVGVSPSQPNSTENGHSNDAACGQPLRNLGCGEVKTSGEIEMVKKTARKETSV
ncbi:unnamed protein product [Orchesella dallaii]|uniref:Uncharacterized protein n=1 Tax=Orchesella dallaii TaxID=48710 RepID=A0ABP1RGF5_9HEXA